MFAGVLFASKICDPKNLCKSYFSGMLETCSFLYSKVTNRRFFHYLHL